MSQTLSADLMARAVLLRVLGDLSETLENVLANCWPHLEPHEQAAIEDFAKAIGRLDRTLGTGVPDA